MFNGEALFKEAFISLLLNIVRKEKKSLDLLNQSISLVTTSWILAMCTRALAMKPFKKIHNLVVVWTTCPTVNSQYI